MSPDQALRRPVDFRSDIFALGAVLFELLTCEPIRTLPCPGPDAIPALLRQAPRWSLLPGDMPEGTEAVLRRMPAPLPADRYQDTDELARDLEYCIYRTGYVPTIQTVEKYLREHFPYLYKHRTGNAYAELIERTTIISETRKSGSCDASKGSDA